MKIYAYLQNHKVRNKKKSHQTLMLINKTKLLTDIKKLQVIMKINGVYWISDIVSIESKLNEGGNK